MRTLNDSLRDELNLIIEKEEYKDYIEQNKIDMGVLKKAFDILLERKSDANMIDTSRTEFENYLINHFKSKKNDNK